MTASVPALSAPVTPGAATTNVAGRVVATAVMLFGGLVLTAGAIGVSVMLGVIERGSVIGSASDVTALRALSPIVPLIAIFGVAHLVAGLGAALGKSSAFQLGLGLGAVDVVAGILAMFVTALSEKPALDGAAIGISAIVLGTVLFAAVRAATYDPATDPAAALA
jgi:hypothetical protein